MENVKLAVQVSIVPREPDVNGKEDYKESEKIDEMFRIFPNQIVLEPKGVRTVRVTYTGTPQIGSELAFRVIAEELPIDLDDPKKAYTKAMAKITLSTRYIGSLYVTPKSAKPEIVAEAKKSETDSKMMILTVNNKGSLHQVYRKPSLKVTSTTSGQEFQFPESELKNLTSQNVLAGRSRVYSLPWPKDIPADGPLKVTLDAGPE
jgi:fimbrial chaperone protein